MFFPPPIEDLHRIYQPFLFSSFLSSLLFSAVDFLFVTSIPENPWNLTKVSVNLVKKKKKKIRASINRIIQIPRTDVGTTTKRRRIAEKVSGILARIPGISKRRKMDKRCVFSHHQSGDLHPIYGLSICCSFRCMLRFLRKENPRNPWNLTRDATNVVNTAQ